MAQLEIEAVLPVSVYTVGSTATDTFTIPFEFFNADEIKIYVGAALQAASTYTVNGTAVDNGFDGGSVVLDTAVTNVQVTVLRAVKRERLTNFPLSGPFDVKTLNTQIAALYAMIQEIDEELDRSIKAAPTVQDLASSEFALDQASRKLKFFAFDENGDLTVSQEIGTFQGDWAAGTAYAVRDLVRDSGNGNVYFCKTAHTSSGSVPISTNVDAAKWDLIVDVKRAEDAKAAAETAETNAASSASAAATSETNAATSETNAASSASAAATSETNADNLWDAMNGVSGPLSNVQSINGGQLAGFRNWIINGNFTINQRGASTKAQASGVYGYDRWKGTQNVGSNTNTLLQIIESLPAGEYTLSWTGGGDGRVRDITGSTWLSSTAVSPITFTSTNDGNQVGAYVPANATEVQLERGTVATPFEHRPYTLESLLCYRYYYASKQREIADGLESSFAGQRIYIKVLWPIPTRVNPTFSYTVSSANSATSNELVSTVNATGCYLAVDFSGTGNNFFGASYTIDAEL